MDLELHRQQSIAYQSEATEILYGGAAGGGKSHLMRVAAISWCADIPGLQVYIFRRLSTDLAKNHMEGPSSFPVLLSEWVDKKFVKINYSDNSIEFWNGSKIFLCHCQYEKDKYKYQGAEIHVLLIDELTHFTDSIYRYLRGRVRMAGLELPTRYKGRFPRIINGSNPGGTGHNWVKSAFVDLGPMTIARQPKAEGGMLRQYIPAKIDDNPTLIESDPEYMERLEGLGNPALVKAMKSGDWNIIEGGMFDDVWNEAAHVLEPFEIPKSWHVDRSFDWGSSKPFSVGWWAESDGSEATLRNGTKRNFPRGTLFRIGEWYGWSGKPNEGLKMLAGDIAKGIKERESAMGMAVKPGPADNAIFDTQDGHCIADNMASQGVRWERSDKSPGSRKNGWELIRGRLAAALEKDENGRFTGPKQGPMEEPGLFVFNTCRQFIRTFPTLPRDEVKTDDIDTEAEDHCFSAEVGVDTNVGTVPIAKITPGIHKVWSGLKWVDIVKAGITRRNTRTVKVKFENGTEIICTPDHKFMDFSGEWRYAIDLKNKEVLCDLRYLTVNNSLSMVKPIIYAGITIKTKVKDFTALCGKSIMGRYLKDAIFTTKMVTGLTTQSKICNVSLLRNTLAAHTANQTGQGVSIPSGLRKLPPQNGTEAKMAKSGIQTITKNISERSCPAKFPLFVASAVKAIWWRRSRRSKASGVDQIVKPLRCVSVEEWLKTDVYCLSVGEPHRFTVENGITVHNCADEVRYRVSMPRRVVKSGDGW